MPQLLGDKSKGAYSVLVVLVLVDRGEGRKEFAVRENKVKVYFKVVWYSNSSFYDANNFKGRFLS